MNDLSSIDSGFIRKLDEIIFENLENENFGVKELARGIGLSRFSLNRKLHFIYKKTINQYIREVRLQQAMKMLQQGSVTASEVAFKVGFSSPAYFSTCFSDYFGYPPGEAKKRGIKSYEENKEELPSEHTGKKPEFLQTKTKSSKKKKKRKIRQIIAFVPFTILIAIVLIYFFNSGFLNNSNHLKNQKKSIAVLPFINDSKDPENVYFINGVMEAILDNLSKVKDLEVRPRTSVEQYRNNSTKTIPQIAKELGVNYIIEGSGQRIGNQVNLYIQLIDVRSDKHLFSNSYNMKLEDIFNLQSEVAIKVASEIEAVITVGEKELIKKPPTTSVAAWEMYSRGFELHNIALLEGNIEKDRQAEVYFRRAIRLDSTYAEPYVQLGWLYNLYNIDSAFFYAEKALHFDHKNYLAYCLRGNLFLNIGQMKKAEEDIQLAIQYNPNRAAGYRVLAEIHLLKGDSYTAIKNQLKALNIENNSIDGRYDLIYLWRSFIRVGFYDEGEKYAKKLIVLTGDSTYYYWNLLLSDLDFGKYESVVKSANKIYNIDTLNLGKVSPWDNSYFLVNTYVNLRDYKEALRLLKIFTGSMMKQGRKIEPDFYFGFVYLQNGQKEAANYHFEESIKERLEMIKQIKPSESNLMHLDLVYIYAATGEKAKALKHLHLLNSLDSKLYFSSQITEFRISPMLDCIRNEPEYKEFLKNAEAQYLKEHNKVERLLQAEGVLLSSNK